MSVGSPAAGTWSSSQWRPDNEFETDRCGRGGGIARRGPTVGLAVSGSRPPRQDPHLPMRYDTGRPRGMCCNFPKAAVRQRRTGMPSRWKTSGLSGSRRARTDWKADNGRPWTVPKTLPRCIRDRLAPARLPSRSARGSSTRSPCGASTCPHLTARSSGPWLPPGVALPFPQSCTWMPRPRSACSQVRSQTTSRKLVVVRSARATTGSAPSFVEG